VVPPNNRLKLAARGRSVANERLRTRPQLSQSVSQAGDPTMETT